MAYAYRCVYAEDAERLPWARIEPIGLADTVTGAAPRLATKVKACWTDRALHIRFDCEDDHVVSTMGRRDDPLYEEDVVEVFLDETGEGRTYLEFEVSPANVLFDAEVTYYAEGSIRADTDWDAVGIETSAGASGAGARFAELRIPFENFRRAPSGGTAWRWNAYRIDEDRSGVRQYSAWSPTGKVNFHMPGKFGELLFVIE
ncbi:carbohydrate-binding family 9-like protein [Cohnella sp. GCM10027633]|uniref:carbohydrate-binding family 9-like protein n=1 Tax=unclassified Cohnella TaxID=2636738 RepID=UPI0036381EE1